jgi:hypothetical protein
MAGKMSAAFSRVYYDVPVCVVLIASFSPSQFDHVLHPVDRRSHPGFNRFFSRVRAAGERADGGDSFHRMLASPLVDLTS